MADILPSFVQRTIPGSGYVTIVCSSENGEMNFGSRSNEDTENNNNMFKYPATKSSSKKVPTENDEVVTAAGRKDDKVATMEGEVVTRRTEISQGIAFSGPTELSDEDENLSGDMGPITVYAHAVDNPSIQLTSCGESDLDLADEFQRLDIKQPEITDLNKRGPMNGVRTQGDVETEQYSGKFMRPSRDLSSIYEQPYQYAPIPAWKGDFSSPPFYFPNPPSTADFLINRESNHAVCHPTPPSIDVLSLPRTQLPYPCYSHPNPPLRPNFNVGSVVNGPAVLTKSTSGHPGPGLPVFGWMDGTQVSGYSPSDELDLVSEYVKDQMQLEEQAKRMKQNFTFTYNIDAATAAATTAAAATATAAASTTAAATAAATAVSNDASVVNYASDITGPTGNSPCNPCASPNSGIVGIPSTVDMVDMRGSSPGIDVNPASCLNAGSGLRASGSSGSIRSPHQMATMSRSNEDVHRHQFHQTNGLRCGSLSPSGSQSSEHSGQSARYEPEINGPNSVGSSLDSIHSSPMSAIETESSGDESFEERQSKMAEAERKAESYEKEALISPDSNGDMSLHLAMIDDDWYLAEAIINRLVRLNLVKQVINVPNKLQQTPLCLAVIFNKSGIVEKLVENGADVNVHIKTCHEKLGPKFCQPLHLAASRGEAWKKTLRQLMRAENIDLDAFNSDGKSALHCAIESHGKKHNDLKLDCKEILRLLAEHGANLNQPDCGHEKTPLHYAIERRDVGLVTRLLCLATSFQSRCEKSGISQMLEAKTGNGNTALHLAASVEMNTQEHKKMIQQLMCKGADPSVKNSDGFLPRELTKNREIVELLKGRMVTGRSPYSDRKRTA